MARALTPEQVRLLRLRAQRLDRAESTAGETAARTVAAMCGIQAQELPSAVLAVGVRNKTLVAADVENARLTERSIVRTWCMRGTLHLIAAQDVGWLLRLLGPVFIRKDQRRRNQLGLTEAICAEASNVLREALADGRAMTRAELRELLGAQGLPTEGQALYHLLYRAGLEGILCYGPEIDGEPAFVVLHDWVTVGASMDEAAALAEMARCYVAGYGPVAPEDMAAWSGLPLSQVRAGFEGVAEELLEAEIDGAPAFMLESMADALDEPTPDAGAVRLLPAYDPYLLGYAGRGLVVAAQHVKRVHPGGGIIRPTIVFDGRAVGTWRMTRSTQTLAVTVEPFESLDKPLSRSIEDEARDLGRFYGASVKLTIMKPSGSEVMCL